MSDKISYSFLIKKTSLNSQQDWTFLGGRMSLNSKGLTVTNFSLFSQKRVNKSNKRKYSGPTKTELCATILHQKQLHRDSLKTCPYGRTQQGSVQKKTVS